MALQKPQVAECIDGKAHIWMIVAEDQAEGVHLEHRWCKKCGCLTQVGLGPDNQPVIAVDEDGAPHLAVPKILNVLIK